MTGGEYAVSVSFNLLKININLSDERVCSLRATQWDRPCILNAVRTFVVQANLCVL